MNAPLPVQRRIVGESRVWLTALGLTLGLGMVATLLGVVLWNGLGVFWPGPVHEYELRGAAAEAATVRVAAVEVERRPRRLEDGTTAEEVLLSTANKDVYGQGFRWVAADAIAGRTLPADLLVIERIEKGHLVGYPVALVEADGARLAAGDAAFADRLRVAMREVAERRDEIRVIERDRIGEIARRMTELRRERRSDAAATAEMAELQRRSDELAAQAQTLRQRQNERKLEVRLASGEGRTLPFGQVVDAFAPNQLGTGGRIGRFLHNVWIFVSDRPRESNTEGGVFPAIFGTFFMTLLMCLAVVPFGVVAAIYLREYARQGPVVRAVRIAINNLAGVPSIVFGVFGLGFFVYFLGGRIDDLFFSHKLPEPTWGTGNILWAALTLALMTVPVVIIATEEAIAAVPRGAREASLAIGASKWQTIQRIVLPASIPGILTGTILAMARGAGEVAPLMLVGVVKLAPTLTIDGLWLPEDPIPYVHLQQKFMHLGFHIYDLGFQSPDSDAVRPMVFATTLLLILLVLVLNLTAILLRERLRRRFAVSAF